MHLLGQLAYTMRELAVALRLFLAGPCPIVPDRNSLYGYESAMLSHWAKDDDAANSSALEEKQPPMPKGPKGEKRPADVIGATVKVMKIATGEIEEDFQTETMPNRELSHGHLPRRPLRGGSGRGATRGWRYGGSGTRLRFVGAVSNRSGRAGHRPRLRTRTHPVREPLQHADAIACNGELPKDPEYSTRACNFAECMSPAEVPA